MNSFVHFYEIFAYQNTLEEEQVCEIDQQIFIQRIKVSDQLILVADIMKSLTLYQVETKGSNIVPKMLCRDPRGSWCIDMIRLTDKSFIIADSKKNLVLLTKDKGKVFEVSSYKK